MANIKKNIISLLTEEAVKDSVWNDYLENSKYVEIKEEKDLVDFLSKRINHADFNEAVNLLYEVIANSIEHGVRSAVPLTLKHISGEVA